MQMHNANIQTLTSAATYVATDTSCRQNFLRPDDNQALARRCSR